MASEEAAIMDEIANHIRSIKDKSDDDFEKNITLISTGTLVLSLTFIEKIVDLKEAENVWWLIWSWGSMLSTLFFNLLSHQFSSYYGELNFDDYNHQSFAEDDSRYISKEKSDTNRKSRNLKIRILNWISSCAKLVYIKI
jgi:hypothetical protein